MTQHNHLADRYVPLCACQAGGPLWDRDGEIRPIDSFPVSSPLSDRIRAWGERYRRDDDRPGVAFDVADFTAQGRGIARAIKAEPPDWVIVYFGYATGRRRPRWFPCSPPVLPRHRTSRAGVPCPEPGYENHAYRAFPA